MDASQDKTTDLLTQLGIGDLQPDEQEQLLLDVNELVYKGAIIRLIERMDDATREEFEALMTREAGEDEIEAFLMEKVPDAESAVTETIQELTDDILSVTNVTTE